ncbi:hypothetical protein PUMCH_001160 [Australozyma saopauloensis]|uniref:calcium/calmodulin-dependent protein kinase n=1 Tax=Australozyma saopauloensis TaxID=291208 RepID=A0AAX4H861_9ASCO|nr:hypothetical protein PUMCH_001160 [[Candida] saopauloensis]
METEKTSIRKLLGKLSGQPDSYLRKGNYTFGRTLGAGSFGLVRYARDNSTGEDVAVKIIIKKALKGNAQLVIDELQLLQELHHPHIVGFRDWFESRDKFYIVTQLATGGELFDRIVQQGRFTEHDASVVILQILEAILYLHKHNIVHRDVKPENVLYLNELQDSNVVLADFGIAKRLQGPDDKLTSSAGSFGYAAPEVVQGLEHGKPCDIWSLGVVTYTILCGYSPFRAEDVTDFIAEVRNNNAVVFHAEYWKDVSKDARRFIIKALQFDPEKRSTADELLNDPWLVHVAATHKEADLLPNLKEHFNGKLKFRQVIEMVKLSNRIKKLRALQSHEDDDPHEIDLFGENGVISDSDLPADEGDSKSVDTSTINKYGVKSPLLSWGKFSSALHDLAARDGSKSSVSSLSNLDAKPKGSATSAFQQLVKAATENKDRVIQYDENIQKEGKAKEGPVLK